MARKAEGEMHEDFAENDLGGDGKIQAGV